MLKKKKEQPLPLVTSYKLATKWNLAEILNVGEGKPCVSDERWFMAVINRDENAGKWGNEDIYFVFLNVTSQFLSSLSLLPFNSLYLHTISINYYNDLFEKHYAVRGSNMKVWKLIWNYLTFFNFSNIQSCSWVRVHYFSSDTISLARVSVVVMHNKLI